ncbi:growth-regulating factor 3 [Rhododendron vialii]|uniref:growth-regulating factor 3 n=1 Tax=Rhododendron vialii TaxID=182163 RepID=UPI00266050C4|nr:growth-regulating factor 3 [Rhododendron vialii]
MDFNLKQWRCQQQQQKESEKHQQQEEEEEVEASESSTALPLFVPDQLTSKLSDVSALNNPVDSTPTSTRFSRMGSCLSMGQWKELELQALIFRHLVEGATVPPQLLHHLVLSKSFLLSPSPSPSYYHPLQHFYSHYHHPSLMQSGYWGRGLMDPEPGRCRRTDGKKWRCSRDVVAGQKYCERHVHRGRNRSRKPVEIPTPSTTYSVGGSYGGVASGGSSATALKTTVPFASQVLASGVHFDCPGPSIDLHQLNHRFHFHSPNNSKYEEKFFCSYGFYP